jgi:hypothetical protein
MLELIVSGYLPGTEIQITFYTLIIIVFTFLMLTAFILTWLLSRAEKRITKQVIEAIQAQLESQELNKSAN